MSPPTPDPTDPRYGSPVFSGLFSWYMENGKSPFWAGLPQLWEDCEGGTVALGRRALGPRPDCFLLAVQSWAGGLPSLIPTGLKKMVFVTFLAEA